MTQAYANRQGEMDVEERGVAVLDVTTEAELICYPSLMKRASLRAPAPNSERGRERESVRARSREREREREKKEERARE